MQNQMDYKLIGFVYSIIVRCVLTKEQMAKCESNEFRPGDFCDDNLLLAEAFVWLGYAESIDDLATDDDAINQAWNMGFDHAESNQYFPWKFFHSELEDTIDTTLFNQGDGFRKQEWEQIIKMNVGDTFNEVMKRIA